MDGKRRKNLTIDKAVDILILFTYLLYTGNRCAGCLTINIDYIMAVLETECIEFSVDLYPPG